MKSQTVFSNCAPRSQVWLQYQCLWDMQAENIYNRLGEDLNKWQALLVQIRKARGTFDNAETKKEFGPVVIDYGKVSPAVLPRALGSQVAVRQRL